MNLAYVFKGKSETKISASVSLVREFSEVIVSSTYDNAVGEAYRLQYEKAKELNPELIDFKIILQETEIKENAVNNEKS
jgi:hypothetical protein